LKASCSFFDVGKSRVLGYAPQIQWVWRILSLRLETVMSSDAVGHRGVRLCVLTGRIALNSPQTEHFDPAVEARHCCDGVEGIHASLVCG